MGGWQLLNSFPDWISCSNQVAAGAAGRAESREESGVQVLELHRAPHNNKQSWQLRTARPSSQPSITQHHTAAGKLGLLIVTSQQWEGRGVWWCDAGRSCLWAAAAWCPVLSVSLFQMSVPTGGQWPAPWPWVTVTPQESGTRSLRQQEMTPTPQVSV